MMIMLSSMTKILLATLLAALIQLVVSKIKHRRALKRDKTLHSLCRQMEPIKLKAKLPATVELTPSNTDYLLSNMDGELKVIGVYDRLSDVPHPKNGEVAIVKKENYVFNNGVWVKLCV